jgi:hypothetical protein
MKTLSMAVLASTLLCGFLVHDALAQQVRGRGRSSIQSKSNTQQQPNARRKSNMQNQANGQLSNLFEMREEEKLARDVYLSLNEKWGDRIFANIAQAEMQHMRALENLLAQARSPASQSNDVRGVFTLPRFQKLYADLISKGASSHIEAIQVGLKIEEMDIVDLQKEIQATNNAQVKRVLQNLQRGSRNHLRAFASRLKDLGGTYVATELSQAEFDQVANSKQETGRSDSMRGQRGKSSSGMGGRGAGQGQGKGQRRGRQTSRK